MSTTRLLYRISDVQRFPASGMVCFRLRIGMSGPGYWSLTETEFQAFTEDLGLSPTTPAATEYAQRTRPLHRDHPQHG